VVGRRLRGEHSAHGLVRSAGNAEPRDLQAANPRAASAAPLPYRAILSTVASLNLFLYRLVAFHFAVAEEDNAVRVHGDVVFVRHQDDGVSGLV